MSSGATDDFAGLTGMMGTIKDIQFDPFLGPVVEFWKVGGFSFELSTLDEVTPLGFESTFLNLSGTGIVRGAGFLDTLGSWTFTGLAGGIQFNWLGNSDAGGISVPEPMVLALIGIGLVGFGGVRGFRGRRAPGKK